MFCRLLNICYVYFAPLPCACEADDADDEIQQNTVSFFVGKGYFAECGLRNAESCERVICGKFDADFFCGMKGKVRNESMRNVTGINIY